MDNHNMFVRRPKPGDSEEDILVMQKEWEMAKEQNKQRATVQVQRMRRSETNTTAINEERVKIRPNVFKSNHNLVGGRFNIDLENITEEGSNQILFDVEEKNEDWLEGGKCDELAKQGTEKFHYSKDDGFPDVLDLRAYYDDSLDARLVPNGKSFFAAEFERLHGQIEDVPCTSSEKICNENFYSENDKFIANLSEEKVAMFRKEIEEKIGPKFVSFLTQRKSRKTPLSGENSKRNASKFKQSRQVSAETQMFDINSSTQTTETDGSSQPTIDDVIKQLEVLNEFTDRKDEENYNRLAAGAVQLDFATKCLRSMVPRQQQNAIKLFDNCKIAPDGVDDNLLTLARSCIDDIKKLYLEEVKSGDHTFLQFAKELNPMVNGSWMLVPIRTVLDAVHKREGHVLSDDLEIIKLSLLWTILIHDERPSAFHAFAEPIEIYVRLAEVFLIGSEVFTHEVIKECISRLLNGYILKSAREGRLVLRLTSKVGGLDAFMPFFEDLLRHFEEYSLGDVNFAKTLLIGTYLNSAIGDSMEFCLALWSSRNLIIRQMTIGIKDGVNVLADIKLWWRERASIMENQYYVQYTSLLGTYAAAIRDEKVTRDRNPIMFAIAADELGRFIQRHTQQDEKMNPSQANEFYILVGIIRSTVKSQLEL